MDKPIESEIKNIRPLFIDKDELEQFRKKTYNS